MAASSAILRVGFAAAEGGAEESLDFWAESSEALGRAGAEGGLGAEEAAVLAAPAGAAGAAGGATGFALGTMGGGAWLFEGMVKSS